MTTALIGATGVIGNHILTTRSVTHLYNSSNIEDLVNHEFDLVICTAPSGNRMQINKNIDQDQQAIQQIIRVLSNTKIARLVLISTVDTVTYPDTPYGQHRKILEQAVKQQFTNSHIVRLSTLIGPTIKKNVLYDLKHNQFIDSIAANAELQWCPLTRLNEEIDHVIKNNINELCLVSEPITNGEIAAEFFSDKIVTQKHDAKKYNIAPYRYSKEEIFTAIKEYICS